MVKTVWARVRLPGRIEGELELAPVTVIMGLPRSGKTALLKLLYGAMRGVKYADLRFPAHAFGFDAPSDGEFELVSLRGCKECEPQLSLVCSRDGCRVVGRLDVKPLLVPADAEAVVRYYFAPFAPWHYFQFEHLVSDLRIGSSRQPACTGGYEEVLASMPEPKLVSRDGKLYEALGDVLVDIRDASTTTAKLGVLEESLRRGLLDEYTHIFLDSPDAGLHPLSQAKLALLMHALANCGKTVVVATHNVMFVDMLTRTDYVNKMLKADVKPADVAIYAIEDGRIKRYEPYASYIRDYTPYIYALYGYSPVEWGKDYMVLRRGGP